MIDAGARHVVGIHKTAVAIGHGRKPQYHAVCNTCGWQTTGAMAKPKSGTREWAQTQALWHARESLKSQKGVVQ